MRRSLQFGHAELAMSRSSAVSTVQSSWTVGSGGRGEVCPIWFTILRQPLAVVQAGRPNWLRYVARSLSAFLYPNASTIAIVAPAPFVVSSLYALTRSGGPNP